LIHFHKRVRHPVRAMTSLAEKLAALSNPAPEFDRDSEEEDNVTGAKVTEGDYEQDDETGERSYLRTLNAPVLDDARYKGKKIKRKDYQKDRDFMEHSEAELGHMFDFGEDDEEDDDEEDDEEEGDNEGFEGEDQEMEDDESGTEDQSNDLEEDSDNDENDGEDEDEDDEDEDGDFGMDISSFADQSNQNLHEAETEGIVKISETDSMYSKGLAVTKQLACWDKLLEQRIFLQKMLTKVNRFPIDVESFVDPEDKEHLDLIKQANKAFSKTLVKCVTLKNRLDSRAVEDCEKLGSDLDDVRSWLERDFESGAQSRREKISLWSERTQKLGSMSAMNTPTLEQIEQITSNMSRLVKRTQVARMDSDILDQEPTNDDKVENVNIFDDSDFYHHLLRELIEKKTSVNSDQGQVGQHWLQIQKLRSKLKKKVDTKASKGRKVRHDVHTKLVNFMAPVRPVDPMNEAARQELFSSLFGARKS